MSESITDAGNRAQSTAAGGEQLRAAEASANHRLQCVERTLAAAKAEEDKLARERLDICELENNPLTALGRISSLQPLTDQLRARIEDLREFLEYAKRIATEARKAANNHERSQET